MQRQKYIHEITMFCNLYKLNLFTPSSKLYICILQKKKTYPNFLSQCLQLKLSHQIDLPKAIKNSKKHKLAFVTAKTIKQVEFNGLYIFFFWGPETGLYIGT